MSKSLSPPPSQPRRIACDRCHGQKLKCPRDENGGPCTRCAKAGAVCHVSPPRATGRPAKHPKPGHKRNASVPGTAAPRPSLSESSSAEDIAPTTEPIMPSMNNAIGPYSSPEEFMNPNMMHNMPINADMSKYSYPAPDMPFEFVNVADDLYSTPMAFDYNASNYMHFGQSPPLPSGAFPHDMSMGFNPAMATLPIHAMPPPPTPSLPSESSRDSSDDTRFDEVLSRRGSMQDFSSRNTSDESVPQFPLSQSSSPSLKRCFTVAEESPAISTLPLRSVSEQDVGAAKKRRFSNIPATGTPNNEENWNSNLAHSQSLTSLQQEVETFSKNLTTQAFGLGAPVDSEFSVDVGVLIPLSERFMMLVAQVCPQVPSSPRMTPRRRSTPGRHVRKPSMERSHTDPESSQVEHTFAEPSSVDAGLVQQIFECYRRIHIAFGDVLDIISHNQSSTTTTNLPSHHLPASRIGSYTLPTSSPLSTIIHLQAISHCLEGLDSTLHKHLTPDVATTAEFLEGLFSKQKRTEMALQSFKEKAFDEADERKDSLMARVRGIFCEVDNREA